MNSVKLIEPGNFEMDAHYYPKVINSHIHPMVKSFLAMSNERITNRYCHLHPEVDREVLTSILNYNPSHFYWSGCDLFPVTNEDGFRKMVLIETNSCPSGQKSFPLFDEIEEQGRYRFLIENSFIPAMKKAKLIDGKLAVIFDKNKLEASGYASTIADLLNENVYLVNFYKQDEGEVYKFEEGILYIKFEEKWIPIRAAYKYVTQKPWNRIPVKSKSFIYNPIITCLAGGRNKLIASKAYDLMNGQMEATGLKIRIPETIWDVTKQEVPLWVQKMGGFAVVKNPYSNAGQGVYTITSDQELQAFMAMEHNYDLFIVQSLIGNSTWTSTLAEGKLYHIGTVPNKKNQYFVCDLRMMIVGTSKGYRPVAMYARRAHSPLKDSLDSSEHSWMMLGTNLSVKLGEDSWSSETERLLLMDTRDFNKLGLGLDDLIEGFIQAVLANISIDKMSINLLDTEGHLQEELFTSLDNDKVLNEEIMRS